MSEAKSLPESSASLPEWMSHLENSCHHDNCIKALSIAWEALEKCNSPETDWENGEIGVGNIFRHITKEALRRIAAIGGDAESIRELGETK